MSRPPRAAAWLGIPALVPVLLLAEPSLVRAGEPAPASSTGGSAAALGAPGAARVTSLDDLLARCAKISGLSARFTEQKQIALLAVPLRSEGTLHFARGRGLARHAVTPSRQSVLVTDKELVLWDGKTTRRVSLGSSSALETFVQAFSYILTANRAALEERFTIEFGQADNGGDGDVRPWHLKLTPKAADLRKLLQSVELAGKDLEIATLTVRESNGDVSTTRFSEVDVNKAYTDAELDRLFRAPPGPSEPPRPAR